MYRIGLFVEDVGHETFLTALLKRLAEEHHIEIHCQAFSERRVHKRSVMHLNKYLLLT